MKSVHYVASVVKIYREAINLYYEKIFHVKDEWKIELDKIAHRPYTTGFFVHDENGTMIHDSSKAKQSSTFLGIVREFDETTKIATVEQRGKLKINQKIEILQPNEKNFSQILNYMTDEEGNSIEAAPHAQQIVKIKFLKNVQTWSLIRTLDSDSNV